MSNRFLFVLLSLLLASVAVLFVLHFVPQGPPAFFEGIATASVREMLLEKVNGKTISLPKNLSSLVIHTINTGEPLRREEVPSSLSPAPFKKIIIHLYSRSHVTLEPLGFAKETFYFLILDPHYHTPQVLKDTTHGRFRQAFLHLD